MSDEIPLSDAERAFFDAMNGGGEEDTTANGHDHHDDHTHGGSGHEDNTREEEDTVLNDEDMDKEYGGQEGDEEEEGQEHVSDHHNIGESEDGDAGDSSVPLQSGAGDSSSSAVEANPAPETSSFVVPTATPPPVLPQTASSASSAVPVGAQEISKPDTPVNASKPGTPATDNKPPVTMTVVAPSESNSKTAGGKRKRLPQDVVGQLEDRISEDPKGDVDAWLGLIDEYKRKGKFDDARAVYERFLIVFPTAAHQWIAYIKMELDNNELMRVEQVFSRCLLTVMNVELWSLYLDYIRRRNNLTNDPSGKARGIVSQAYEFVLGNIGHDREAGRIWQDQLAFIKSAPGSVGGSGWQDQQKMDSLRKAYQKAVTLPVEGVEKIWKEYDQFEQGLNKLTARKFLQERSPAFMTARSSLIELNNLTRDLRRETIPHLRPAPGCEGEEDWEYQVTLWKRWIKWERDDPLVLAQDDPAQLKTRIVYVYKQALMAMRYYPEFWYDASDYCYSNGMDAEGLKFLQEGIQANPESALLTFKYVERLEQSQIGGEEGESAAIRRGALVRKPYDALLDALYGLYAKTQAREKEELEKIEDEFANQQENGNQSDDGFDNDSDDEDEGATKSKKTSEKDIRITAVKESHKAELVKLSKVISAVWINLMRAMRRIQGHGKVNDALGGSRQIFADARKRGKITSDVYIASALIEYHCYRDPAALRIFERGMKLFPEDEDFALEYLKHLVNINDITNARALFSTFVNRVPPNKARRVYDYFHAYESYYGDLTQIQKLEAKMNELYPSTFSTNSLSLGFDLFTSRHTHHSIDPCDYSPIISRSQLRPKLHFPPPPPLPLQNHDINNNLPPRIYTPPPMPAHPILPPAAAAAAAIATAAATRPLTPPPPPQQQQMRINSPKRPADDMDGDHSDRARKIPRGDSPLKGAAGRRLNQLKQQAAKKAQVGGSGFDHDGGASSGGPSRDMGMGRERDRSNAGGAGPSMGGSMGGNGGNGLPDAVMELLKVLPPAHTYHQVRFRPEAMVGLLLGVNVPSFQRFYGA